MLLGRTPAVSVSGCELKANGNQLKSSFFVRRLGPALILQVLMDWFDLIIQVRAAAPLQISTLRTYLNLSKHSCSNLKIMPENVTCNKI